jgi:hypothetical protein
MKPIVAELQGTGIIVVIYPDDLAIISPSFDQALQDLRATVKLLESLGFVINQEKSHFQPSQVIEYLGFQINSLTMQVFLPMGKMNHLLNKARLLSNSASCTIRKVAGLIGLIVSSFPAIKPAKLYYRNLDNFKTEALHLHNNNYDASVPLTALARPDLFWFITKSQLYNGASLIKPAKTLQIATDASNLGWGAVYNSVTTSGTWAHNEGLLHINCLELKAVLFAVQCFVLASGLHVKVFSDNGSVVV